MKELSKIGRLFFSSKNTLSEAFSNKKEEINSIVSTVTKIYKEDLKEV